eukprot:SAG22_NODE_1160_length_5317_cov_44.271560_4_plen_40_part_00
MKNKHDAVSADAEVNARRIKKAEEAATFFAPSNILGGDV